MATRVLIVDDVPELRALFRMALDFDHRFEVVGEAGDGEAAIARARELRPDVVVLDLAMPKMDGMRAIPLLHEASPGIRILVLSGFETPRIEDQAIKSCATAFLSKGTPVSRIVSTLHQVSQSPPKKGCFSAA